MKIASQPTKSPLYSQNVFLNQKDSLELCEPQAARAFLACMNMQSTLGGAASHWGGPSAFIEIFSSLLGLMFKKAQEQKKDWTELFHFVNDAGHCQNALYVLWALYGFANLKLDDLKTFRSSKGKLTGHGESHLFPEAVYFSNGPLGSTVAQAEGLALADKIKSKERITVLTMTDGAFMEGEAKEALSSLVGFASKRKLAPFVLIISDNNTKLSGRIDEDSFSLDEQILSLKHLGYSYLELKQGNDLNSCTQVLDKAFSMAKANPEKPVLVHAKTVKGFGVLKTERSSSGGHGFPLKKVSELDAFLKEIVGKSTLPKEVLAWQQELLKKEAQKSSAQPDLVIKEKAQVGVSKALIQKKTEGLNIFSLSSDLFGSTGLGDFRKKFPESSLDLGVAESNMFSVASAFSKQGFIPIVDTFAQFAVTKGALPLTMANLSQSPVIAILSHVGFQDAADGASHQALSYISQVASIPKTKVYSLSCSFEAEALLKQALEEYSKTKPEERQSFVFFLGRENFPQYYKKDFDYKLNQAQVILENQKEKSVILTGLGHLLPELIKASELLTEKGIGSFIIHPACLNDIDVSTYKKYLQKTPYVLSVEDHNLPGGFSALLGQALLKHNLDFKIKSLGVLNQFGRSAYKAQELYKLYGLDAHSIFKSAKDFLKI